MSEPDLGLRSLADADLHKEWMATYGTVDSGKATDQEFSQYLMFGAEPFRRESINFPNDVFFERMSLISEGHLLEINLTGLGFVKILKKRYMTT